MNPTKLILVGGFLGSGKTTLLHTSAGILKKRGFPVGLITNDQASGLVDTAYLEEQGNLVREVSGSCFCCNFHGFAEAVEQIAGQIGGGVTIAESVGSCTDLSATIMQPLKERYRDLAVAAPLSVVADPERLKALLDGKKAIRAYIVRKQFEEADLILINKIDLLSEEELEILVSRTHERFPNARIISLSAATGEGVDAWLDLVLREENGGTFLADVDYDLYAAGEAAYGWLNASFFYDHIPENTEPAADAEAFLKFLVDRFAEEQIEIGHVKFLLHAERKRWIGNLTGGTEGISLRGETAESAGFSLTVNARAETGPKLLQDLVLRAVDRVFRAYPCIGTEIRSLIPGRPSPTYHYDSIVQTI
ncbi:MAG: cobalamin synthesis protein P47K [Lachnospiraceae bacterium]|nr:cobalamin synthesis protein P47K [Lachnospiraceae bacterium]